MLNLQQVISDADLEPFGYIDAEGSARQLPNVRSFSLAFAARLDSGDLTAFNEVEPGLADEITNLPGFAAQQLIKGWLQHGAASGESEASSSSSGRTAGPSKRTSRGTSTSKTRRR